MFITFNVILDLFLRTVLQTIKIMHSSIRLLTFLVPGDCFHV